ncbi:MAG TPA: hypothetical protein VHW44_14330 [Pseudonocardiaceae bacterium]|nr:hypothetical protein [Pseudonocardiaceae bacterium]
MLGAVWIAVVVAVVLVAICLVLDIRSRRRDRVKRASGLSSGSATSQAVPLPQQELLPEEQQKAEDRAE